MVAKNEKKTEKLFMKPDMTHCACRLTAMHSPVLTIEFTFQSHPFRNLGFPLCMRGIVSVLGVQLASLLFVMQAGATSLRYSPEVAEQISSSLRSAIVLPANRLLKPAASTCDSLTGGPFCSLFSEKRRPATGGLIEVDLWDELPRRVFDRNYKTVSKFAQTHWWRTPEKMSRNVRISTLVRATGTNTSCFHLSINPISVDSLGFVPSEPRDSDSLLVLNSHFGYVSFFHEVSVFEMKVRAPLNSHVLVRSFNDGVSVWSRIVRSGQTVDVARACNETDPSVEAVDYIEIIGAGAEILSFHISSSSEKLHRTFVFLDSNLLKPSRYAGIRTFPPSAYLVDMETAATEGMYFGPDPIPLISAIYDSLLSSDSLIYQLERADSYPSLPTTQLDYFVRLVERRQQETDFETSFRDLLIESPPEVMSFLFKPLPDVTVVHPESPSRQFADRIRRMRGDIAPEPELELPPLVKIKAKEPVVEAANTIAIALMAHLGREKFESIVLRSKLERLTQSQNVSLEGVDEPALVAVITEGFGIPIDSVNRKSIFAKIVDILLEGSAAESAGTQLVELLLA